MGAGRWWTYQRERFPLAKTGLLVAVLSFSAVTVSGLVRGAPALPGAASTGVAFVTLMAFFAQLRIADEHKDFEDDSRFRPYRPVPRGLVTLGELRVVAFGLAALQVALALLLSPWLLPLLALVWAYLGLMTAEFFVPSWLKARPLAYLFSHMPVMALIVLYASACDWVPARVPMPAGLGALLVMGFFNGIVVEVGRKLRAPEDEETGVETYTALYGPTRAVAGWMAAVACAGAAAVALTRAAAGAASLAVPVTIVLAACAACGIAAGRFLGRPEHARAAWLEPLAGVWVIASYLTVALVPLVVLR